MRYVMVRVERNEHLAIARPVAPWEIPVLELVHGQEKIIVVGDEFIDRELPDAGAEFDRLSARYGEHVPTETAYSVMVFGQAPKGIQAIAEMIEQERTADARRAKQAEAAYDPTA